MAKKGKVSPPLRLGAIATTHRPGQNSRRSAKMEPWKWEFYILPSTDEGNEKVVAVLSRYGDVRTFERCMALPGYDEKQFVYAVKKQVMDFVERNTSITSHYKAWVRYEEGGKPYRYRTEEQKRKSKERRQKKLAKQAARKEARA